MVNMYSYSQLKKGKQTKDNSAFNSWSVFWYQIRHKVYVKARYGIPINTINQSIMGGATGRVRWAWRGMHVCRSTRNEHHHRHHHQGASNCSSKVLLLFSSSPSLSSLPDVSQPPWTQHGKYSDSVIMKMTSNIAETSGWDTLKSTWASRRWSNIWSLLTSSLAAFLLGDFCLDSERDFPRDLSFSFSFSASFSRFPSRSRPFFSLSESGEAYLP